MFSKKENPQARQPSDAGDTSSSAHDDFPPLDDGSGVGGSEQDRAVAELATVTLERDQARADHLRALAEFQNYQRRAMANEAEAKRQGATSVLNSVLPVLDHFDMAINQPADSPATQRVIDGVKVIRAELIRALERHGVVLISPQINDTPNPSQHSVLMHKPGDGVEPGQISSVMQVGYALGDRVIRPAMVTVAPQSGENE